MQPVAFLVNVDWFFKSHFRHLALRLIAEGRSVYLVTQAGPSSADLEHDGIKIVPLPNDRSGLRPSGLAASINVTQALLSASPDMILHAFGNFGVVVGALAARKVPKRRIIYHIIGRGFLAAYDGLAIRALREGLRQVYRLADGENVRWVAENTCDLDFFALKDKARVTVVTGAGVDTNHFSYQPVNASGPLRLGYVSRLIYSKGLDTLIEAFSLVRERGLDVSLSIAGSPDPGNPKSWSQDDLDRMCRSEGIHQLGFVDDIKSFWIEHDVAVLPSRGGEGLPKALLEACAIGRPIITTTVPGCHQLALDTSGWAVTPGRPDLLANAIIEAAKEKKNGLLRRGETAAQYVQETASEGVVWSKIKKLY